MIKRTPLLAIAAATLVAGCNSPLKQSERLGRTTADAPPDSFVNAPLSDIQRFVIRSDTQFPRTDEGIDDEDKAKALIEAQDAAIEAYRDGDRYLPIFLNGDVTEYGHGNQWSYMAGRLYTMEPVFWGLGNHDYENNLRGSDGSGCYNNGCARDSVLKMIAAVRDWKVDAFDEWEEGTGDPFYQKYHGSLSYSKTIGKFTFIQLQNHYNYSAYWWSRGLEKKEFYIENSLNWLQAQLKRAQDEGKFVIINMHRPPGDSNMGSELDRKRFESMVSEAGVVAIFNGHTHNAGKRPNFGTVPVFDSGAAFRKTFLVGEYDTKSEVLTIKQANNNKLDETLANIKVVYTGKVPAPEVVSSLGALSFTVRQPTATRERPFASFELSFNGGAYQPMPSGKLSIQHLESGTTYSYTLRATDTKGNASPTPYSGTARTLPDIKSPKGLCLKTEDSSTGIRLYARWQPAEPDYWPMPFFFHVALIDANEHIVETIRSAQDDLRRTEIPLEERFVPGGRTEEQLKALDLAVQYVTGLGTGRSPWIKLPLKWLYNAEDSAKVFCSDARPVANPQKLLSR